MKMRWRYGHFPPLPKDVESPMLQPAIVLPSFARKARKQQPKLVATENIIQYKQNTTPHVGDTCSDRMVRGRMDWITIDYNLMIVNVIWSQIRCKPQRKRSSNKCYIFVFTKVDLFVRLLTDRHFRIASQIHPSQTNLQNIIRSWWGRLSSVCCYSASQLSSIPYALVDPRSGDP